MHSRRRSRQSSSLEQEEVASLERPLEIVSPREDLVTAESQRDQVAQLRVVEAKLPRALGRDSCLPRTAPGRGRHEHVLQTRSALTHVAVASDPEAVRDDQSGDHRFPESPARLDHEVRGPAERIPAEEDAGTIGGHQLLNDDGDPRLPQEPESLAV
jgi:hypothetical protein